MRSNTARCRMTKGGSGLVGRWQEPKWRMHWTEMDGPRVTPPKRKGFGSRLIARGLSQDLGGEVRIDFAPTGVTCSIGARLERSEQPGGI